MEFSLCILSSKGSNFVPHVVLQGRVISVPKHSRDVVQIQILCQTMISSSEKEHNDLWDFESLWKNVCRVVESAKTNSPNMTKYQQNFSVLIQEVLQSYPHLFTEDEIIFLGTSLRLGNFDLYNLFLFHSD